MPPRQNECSNGDIYYLYKIDSNPVERLTYIQNSSHYCQIGTYEDVNHSTAHCAIKVFNLLRDIGEDPRADGTGDVAEIRIAFYNSHPDYPGYSSAEWNSNEYEVVLLDNSIAGASKETQWNDVLTSSNVIATKYYNEETVYDVRSIINQGNVEKITVGLRAKNLSNLFAAESKAAFGFKGTVLEDVQIHAYVRNNFTGGQIKAQVGSAPTSSASSPIDIYDYTGETVYIGAVDNQTVGTDEWAWNGDDDTSAPVGKSKWTVEDDQNVFFRNLSSDMNTTFQLTSNEENFNYVAEMKHVWSVTFQNDFTGGVINVRGTQYNSPTSNHKVVEANSITETAVNQTVDGVQRTFSSWTGGSTSAQTTFYPSSTPITYTANFIHKPVWTNRNLHTDSDLGEYVHLIWNEHPCSNVIYKIYRKIKHNGVFGSEVLRATVSHGTHEWTDNIQIADGQTTDLAYYDVRAFYNETGGTYSDVYYDCIDYTWTEQSIKNGDESVNAEMEAEESTVVEENKSEIVLGNFPNPFNPTTNINYSLAEDGFVSLKVYNVLGKEVATLVNESKPAGNYSRSFNASNLPSGVYIYTLQTNGQLFTRKMLLLR